MPPGWLADSRPAAQQLNELFLDLIARAKERVATERDSLQARRVTLGDYGD